MNVEWLVNYIGENCEPEELDGNLKCNKCGSRVIVDWFEQTLECQGCDEL